MTDGTMVQVFDEREVDVIRAGKRVECCGCPACPCGCQYGVPRAHSPKPR